MKIARFGILATGLCARSSHVHASGSTLEVRSPTCNPCQVEQWGLKFLFVAGQPPMSRARI
jgi:hypothetical protein